MAIAPDGQRKRLGGVEFLQALHQHPHLRFATASTASARTGAGKGSLAALWQDWGTIAGERLAPHCRPLSLQRGTLIVGAAHPQWRQALLYTNRNC